MVHTCIVFPLLLTQRGQSHIEEMYGYESFGGVKRQLPLLDTPGFALDAQYGNLRKTNEIMFGI